jgi:hypothetical protein
MKNDSQLTAQSRRLEAEGSRVGARALLLRVRCCWLSSSACSPLLWLSERRARLARSRRLQQELRESATKMQRGGCELDGGTKAMIEQS